MYGKDAKRTNRYEINFRRSQFKPNGTVRFFNLPKTHQFNLPSDPSIYKLKSDERRVKILAPSIQKMKEVISKIEKPAPITHDEKIN